jgi:hypothetical protein
METVFSSETLVNYWPKQCHIPKDSVPQSIGTLKLLDILCSLVCLAEILGDSTVLSCAHKDGFYAGKTDMMLM